MATKPTETLAFEPTTVVVVPTAKQAVGFVPGERPPAQYLSWLFRILSRLYNYVIDGNFTGNHTITGTLGVAGNTTVTGTFDVDGATSVSGTATVDDLLVTADATISGTLTVTGVISDGDKTIVVPVIAAIGTEFGSSLFASDTWRIPLASKVIFPVVVDAGKRILSVDVVCDLSSGLGGQLTITLKRWNLLTGAIVSVASMVISTIGRTTISLAAVDHVVLSTDQYHVVAERLDAISGTIDVFGVVLHVGPS